MSKIKVKPGAFPFSLVEGPEESAYLTWVRNHSNYLVQRGVVDYFRFAAVLVRGILVNFLTLIPFLLLGAVLLSFIYNDMLDDWKMQVQPPAGAVSTDAVEFQMTREVSEGSGWVAKLQALPLVSPPFLVTPILGAVALLLCLLFPVGVRLFKVFTSRRSIETGSESSVKQRDSLERFYGYMAIVVLATAAIEALPLLFHHFHQWRGTDMRNIGSLLAGVTSVTALSGAGRLVRNLGAAGRKIALLLVGLLGLILPLLAVVHVTELLVYSNEVPFDAPVSVLMVWPVVLSIAAVGAVIGGWRGVSAGERAWLLGLLLLPLSVTAAVSILAREETISPWLFVLVLAGVIWLFCRLTVDVNLTGALGFYRDRLASAYLLGRDKAGHVGIEQDVDLHDMCRYSAFSIAPYQLMNVAHNLQASKDISIRERNSDFFLFSKRFIGGQRTGYCASETLETVYPQMDVATAMAISAAAAAPNMGANTSRGLVALLTILNVRLGYWIPNPGLVAGALAKKALGTKSEEKRSIAMAPWRNALSSGGEGLVESRMREMIAAAEAPAKERLRRKNLGFSFQEVFAEELSELRKRWANVYDDPEAARGAVDGADPSPRHGLVGLAFSGGGIRSATLNLGISQALDQRGVFPHVDYLSSVSGGGYLAASLATLMRTGTRLHSHGAGAATVEADEKSGRVRVSIAAEDGEMLEYTFRDSVKLSRAVREGRVGMHDHLTSDSIDRAGLKDRFAWRVLPNALWRELFSRLDETSRWVNLSDGGHIENLAAIELLRRRCRYIVIGDGAADSAMSFKNLATLIRYARIDMGIEIEIDAEPLRQDEDGDSADHFALGRVNYPKLDGSGYEDEHGWILYLKSSISGDEEELIKQYRASSPMFPHESTADQFFSEGQFEAYRALGQHIAEKALLMAPSEAPGTRGSVGAFFEHWFQALETQLPTPWKHSP